MLAIFGPNQIAPFCLVVRSTPLDIRCWFLVKMMMGPEQELAVPGVDDQRHAAAFICLFAVGTPWTLTTSAGSFAFITFIAA